MKPSAPNTESTPLAAVSSPDFNAERLAEIMAPRKRY